MFGFLNINKPSGVSSHSVVASLRKITGIKQIGHAGTLDPLAMGILPIALGKATKLIDYLNSDKKYIAGLEFGKKSDTYDIEGNIEILNAQRIDIDTIKQVLPKFRGEIKQVPPAFSAVHYKGKRLYELAREGKIPNDIKERNVKIYKNEIIEFDEKKQKLKLAISCSKGTYIRSIVNDLGIALNNGAVMYELTRVEAGGMNLNSSLSLNEDLTKEDIKNNLINPASILPIKCYDINENEYKIILNGNKIKNRFNAEKEIFLIKNNIIIAFAKIENDFILPKKILC